MNIDDITHVIEFPKCITPDETHNKFFLTAEEATLIREVAYKAWGMRSAVEPFMLDMMEKYPDIKMVAEAYADKTNEGYLRKIAGEDRIIMRKLIEEDENE